VGGLIMLVLATDLDGTFLGGSLQDRDRLYQRIRAAGDDVVLVFVTGRALANVAPLLADPAIPRPHYVIADVGATVVHGATLAPIEPIDGELLHKALHEQTVLDAIPVGLDLERQQQTQVRRCSFYTSDPSVVDAVRRAVEPLGGEVLYSASRYLDVLPRGVNKGSTLAALVRHLGIDARDVLVAGDTMNDASMFRETGFRGVVVGGAEPALRDAVRERLDTLVATRPGAGGILEALDRFELLDDLGEGLHGDAGLVVVYHRQPFDERVVDGRVERTPPRSPNGIIPTLLGLFRGGRRGAWVAWTRRCAGIEIEERVEVPGAGLRNLTISRLVLDDHDVEQFYDRFSKEALWPVLHGFLERATFDHRGWQHYLDINKRFARQAAREAAPGALVWIHDYNLWLVPEYLRRWRPDVRIAFFHHTPFPAADVFNVIPWSGAIVTSLLACDYVGFHVPRYVENFVDAARAQLAIDDDVREPCDPRFVRPGTALHVPHVTTAIRRAGRTVRLGVHPVGLDVRRVTDCLAQPAVAAAVDRIGRELDGRKVVVCAERLDYVKGSLQKLVAFEQFLAQYPEWRERITLINICTPPARGMTIYSGVRDQIERAVGKLNGRFATPTWTPVTYMFRQVPFEELATYLAVADVGWITPLRDGLNLVAKEYVAVRSHLGAAGVLIISELAGAAIELPGALVTNPYDPREMADTLQRALRMEPAEQVARMKQLAGIVEEYDVEYWARDFLSAAAGDGRIPSRGASRAG
jgi:glucosylglycerol-phosphate synthase